MIGVCEVSECSSVEELYDCDGKMLCSLCRSLWAYERDGFMVHPGESKIGVSVGGDSEDKTGEDK